MWVASLGARHPGPRAERIRSQDGALDGKAAGVWPPGRGRRGVRLNGRLCPRCGVFARQEPGGLLPSRRPSPLFCWILPRSLVVGDRLAQPGPASGARSGLYELRPRRRRHLRHVRAVRRPLTVQTAGGRAAEVEERPPGGSHGRLSARESRIQIRGHWKRPQCEPLVWRLAESSCAADWQGLQRPGGAEPVREPRPYGRTGLPYRIVVDCSGEEQSHRR